MPTFGERVEVLNADVQNLCSQPRDAGAQEAIALLAIYLRPISQTKDVSLLILLETAAKAAAQGNQIACDRIISSLAPVYRRLRFPIRFLYRKPTGTEIVFLGLMLQSFIATVLLLFAQNATEYFKLAARFNGVIEDVGWVSAFGILGAIVSMAMRMEELGNVGPDDGLSILLKSLFRPLIGAAMAVLMYFFFQAQLHFAFPGEMKALAEAGKSPTPNVGAREYLIWSVAFLSGFSERFSRRAVERAIGPD